MTDDDKKADKEEQGRRAASKGFANEQRLLAALLSRNHNASRVDLPTSQYDIVVEPPKGSTGEIIRVQAKTVDVHGNIKFKGGTRGGQERSQISNVKEYVYSTETADVVVGVDHEQDNGDSKTNYYIIPTLLIELLGQKSITRNKVLQGKNNWELLVKCKDKDFVLKTFGVEL